MLYLYHVKSQQYHEIVDQITIGRTTGELIFSEDGRMSGKHAEISFENVDGEDHMYIQDLGSKNFTIVNRAEIPPNQKIRIKVYNLLEVGDQQFVISDSQNLKISDLNELMHKHMSRPIMKLNSGNSTGISLIVETQTEAEMTPQDHIKIKEAKILKMQNEILSFEQAAKAELFRLEEAKQKIIVKTKAKKAELTKSINTLKMEVDKNKEEIAKFRSEVEMKKKKIINLKDLPTDSSEELPE